MRLRAYVVDTVLGVLAYDDDLNLIGAETYPRDAGVIAKKLLSLEQEGYTGELMSLCRKLVDSGYKEIVVEHEGEARAISENFPVHVRVEAPSKAGRFVRANVIAVAKSLGFSDEEYLRILHEASMDAVRDRIKVEAARRDRFVAQAVEALDELDKNINITVSRVREWYGLHFPELDDLLPENRDYVRLVYELGSRRKIDVKALTRIGFSEGKAKQIADAAAKSMGAEVSEADLDPIRKLAKLAIDMYDLRKYFEAYISDTMQEVAPNIRELVGPLLGARLIALAGGLENLAKKPASTIQVLGAEKALFRALRTGGKPPKHGVIFQYPEVHRSPKWQRGKIARALAAKLSIAARVDAFTGEFIADQLKRDFEERVAEIKQKYAKPPGKKKKEKVAKKAGDKK
ncbi:MAG: C/D box methylation guide ribonucleoprotein complex aNOP56 subunit [Candidatus Methanomethylicota archaeon]|uniref:C/D box methylation guide ribonucleoprotein complex aNOP56 subunit n=1 Tax=Thermoproteota archaeon TaxID=2056631 RepID=A0A497F088_9CREN|nr:MAG: C/D box methylation guide ribonucleoprotein complex aNOP56 subunit [Candidatus Verstraetearchaeota archaeon]